MIRTIIKDTPSKTGQKVIVYGWVDSIRSHGKIAFIDLRDVTGVIQLVDLKGNFSKNLGNEFVVRAEGKIANRPEKLKNPKLKTGQIELVIENLVVVSESLEPPFPIDSEGYEINEESRTKFRYLDIRRKRIRNNLITRSKVTNFIRNYLSGKGFYEIETPILTKTTPEGARDFIVPSRLQKGKFYALPQSPQQYKQLLMVAGLERYFQIARCFRDEDPRHDRAYGEFTQLDVERSFVSQDDILQLTENLFTALIGEIFPDKCITESPWPRIPHKTAKSIYGSDRPDLRKDKKDRNELAFAWIIDFPLFNKQTKEDFFHGAGKSKFAPSHHMFTAPHPDDIKKLDQDPLKVRGLQHDLVLNGYEIGGGSIRIHDPKIQEKVFDLIGFTGEQKKQFTHLLTAFKYGVPPHGGIAPGIDRFLMVILGEPSVREVMAFPSLSSGTISVMDAPSPVEPDQLKELAIKVEKD